MNTYERERARMVQHLHDELGIQDKKRTTRPEQCSKA